MKSYLQKAMSFIRDEEGASAVEYAILVAIIAGVVAAAVRQFDLNGIFTTASNKVTTAMGS